MLGKFFIAIAKWAYQHFRKRKFACYRREFLFFDSLQHPPSVIGSRPARFIS